MANKIRKSLESLIFAGIVSLGIGCASTSYIKAKVEGERVIIEDYRPTTYEIKLPPAPTYELEIKKPCQWSEPTTYVVPPTIEPTPKKEKKEELKNEQELKNSQELKEYNEKYSESVTNVPCPKKFPSGSNPFAM